MPNVNLTDSRQRDAVVKAESTAVVEETRYLDQSGNDASTRKILKATVDHDYATLLEKYDQNTEKLGAAMVAGDPEVDIEKCGVYLWGVSKVYVDSDDGIVYRIEQTEIVRDPDGNIKDKRPRKRVEANVDTDIPLTWTGKKIAKSEAVRRFLFSSKLQIVHINGLTYDFLFGMAKDLSDSNSLMMIGGGSKGRDPLIFRSGSIPYRGFLEGRVEGETYVLLLHLSNMELKVPGESDLEKSDSTSQDSVKEGAAPDVSEGKKRGGCTASVSTRENTSAASKNSDSKPKKNSRAVGTTEKTKPTSEATRENMVVTSNAVSQLGRSAAEVAIAEAAPASADLGVWLKSVRMGKYLELFIENEIDVDVLPELTDDDLRELEIPLGSRRRLLKALAQTEDLRAEVAMAVKSMSATPSVDKSKTKKSKSKKKPKTGKES